MENKPTEKMDEEFTQKTYAEFAVKFTCARNIAGALLANCAQARNRSSNYNVYYRITGRTKKYPSAMKKCEAKGVAKTKRGIARLKDIAGLRVVLAYKDDTPKARQDILDTFPGATEKKVKKNSGYDALHMYVKVQVPISGGGCEDVLVEIQIVTVIMDDWSKRQHPDYKKDVKDSEVGKIYRRMAELYREQEELYMALRNEGVYYTESIPTCSQDIMIYL